MRGFISTSVVGWRGVLAAAFLLVATRGVAQPAPSPSAPTRGAPYAILFGSLRTTGAANVETAANKGGDLLTVPVTYAVTDILRDEVKGPPLILLRSPIIPAGTPVFAIPSRPPTGLAPHPELLWCAAQVEPGKLQKPSHWNITCFPKALFGFVGFAPVGQNFFPASFAYHTLDQTTVPDIQEKPIDLVPPLTLVIQFAGWKNNLADLHVIVRQPTHIPFGVQPVYGDQVIAREQLPRDAAGVAHLPVFGGEILIRPGLDGKSAAVEITKPFLIGVPQR